MKKHAYLVIAHTQFNLLKKLIILLDDKRNDIYIHIDKKSLDFDQKDIISQIKYSNIYFIDRISVNWGGYSQIKCELNLLSQAVKNKYEYYHLISGCDLPLKSNDYIHEFFLKNSGKEFVHFCCNNIEDDLKFKDRMFRFCIYHFFQDYKDAKNSLIKKYMNRILLKLQKIIKINRISKIKGQKWSYGAQWFSITHDLASYVLSKQEEIAKIYKLSNCCDEIFLQSIILNSNFSGNLYNLQFDNDYTGIMRYIDWNRGGPYVFKNADYDELMNSKFLFARKFIEGDLVDRIFDNVYKQNS